MATANLLALLDDIATVLDDVSVMTKVAAKKTAGVLGDDLALNAEQVAGIKAEREIPVVKAVAKGSFINKLILVPGALAISAIAPWLITPLLMIGGAYLCFEGFEKIAHKWLLSDQEEQEEEQALLDAINDPSVDMVSFEQDKIKGAIRTDFILSAEIIVISLGVVKGSPFITQVLALSIIAILITIVVYGLVAMIVKMDDAGYHLIRVSGESMMSKFKRSLGRGFLSFAPRMMRSLTVIGTIAMFLVGGGILLHGIPHAHDYLHHAAEWAGHLAGIGSVLKLLTPTVLNGLFGVLAGGVLVGIYAVSTPIFSRLKKP